MAPTDDAGLRVTGWKKCRLGVYRQAYLLAAAQPTYYDIMGVVLYKREARGWGTEFSIVMPV